MLYKSELKAIPPIALDKMKMGKKNYLGVAQTVNNKKCGEVLVVDIYQRAKPRELLFRFYSDKKNYQVYDVKKDAWMQKSVNAVMSGERQDYYGYIDPKYKVAASEDTENVVKKFFNVEYTDYDGLTGYTDTFVRKVNQLKRETARDRKQERIDNIMDMFPEFPSDFKDYLQKDVFNNYIFTDNLKKGVRPGICAYCGKRVELDKTVRHKEVIKCPECGKKSIAFAARYIDSIKDKNAVCMVHRIDGRLMIRHMKVNAGWYISNSGEYKPSYKIEEYFRTVYLHKNGKEMALNFDNKNVWPYGQYWREQNYRCSDLAYLYNKNLSEVFGGKYYNVDLEKELSRNTQPLRLNNLFDNLETLPQTEYLIKMGMLRLAFEISSAEIHEGKNFKSILGINPQYKKLYCEMNVSLNEHRLVQAARDWVSETDFLKMRTFKLNDYQTRIACEILHGMSYKRFVNYFTKQKKIYPKNCFEQILTWYNDYIRMSEQMEIDLSHKSVRFPKDIKETHDRLLREFKIVENEIYDEQLRRASENLYNGLTEYKNNGFAIVFPKTRTEFIAEGQALNHCVGTQEMYFNNHLKGTKMIFFIRRVDEIDKPFVTMEIDMRRLVILQIYGYGDKRPAQEVINFANKFLKLLKQTETTGIENIKEAV